MLQVETIVVGPIETNCYLLINPLRQVLIIDPGAEPEKIKKIIKAKDLIPMAILNTHGHYDHILADMSLSQDYQVSIFYPEEDKYLIDIQKKLYAIADLKIDYFYKKQVKVAGFEIEVLATPGHSKGSSCFLIDGKLFSGDTMFADGYLGRTDLWRGSSEEIQYSLQKILALPDDIQVYPGHGPVTTIGAESAHYV